MKTISLHQILILFLLIAGLGITNAQVVKTKNKVYKKAVKRRTKDYKKQGYIPMGSGTIQLYVTRGVNKEFEEDENGELKFNVVTTKEVGPTFENALTACRASARAAIAGNIETRVAELIKRSLNNDVISERSANGINQVITAGKQLIAQKVSMEDIYTFYKNIKDERDKKDIVEVVYSGCYSNRLAMQKAQEYIRQELKDETEELHKDLDKIFKFDE
jgi:hypothetical protein